MNSLLTLLLTALSGVLTQISLAPAHLYFLSFFALIPFFVSLDKQKTLKGKLLVGLLTGFFANVSGFYWMVLIFKNFFGYTINESYILFLLYALVGHSQFILFAIYFHFLTKWEKADWTVGLQLKHSMLIALGYTLIDYFTPKLFGDTLGNAFDNQPSLRQLSKFLGIVFLTFICSFTSSSIFVDLKNKKIKQTITALIFVVTCGAFGYWENQRQIEIISSVTETIKIAVIQPNTLGPDKLNAESGQDEIREKMTSDILTMSQNAVDNNKDLDAIIWPETSYPAFYTNPTSKKDVELNLSLKSFVLKNHIPIIFGLTDRDFDGRRYNSVILLEDENGEIKSQVYHKVILAFMGEYNPFSKGRSSSLSTGIKPTLLRLKTRKGKEIKISPIVCYEAMSPLYVQQAKKLNPDLLVHISNESWFGYLGLPYSFFYLAAFRAIESEIPMVKAANSGFSGLILPDGSILNQGNLNDKETIIMNVPIIRH